MREPQAAFHRTRGTQSTHTYEHIMSRRKYAQRACFPRLAKPHTRAAVEWRRNASQTPVPCSVLPQSRFSRSVSPFQWVTLPLNCTILLISLLPKKIISQQNLVHILSIVDVLTPSIKDNNNPLNNDCNGWWKCSVSAKSIYSQFTEWSQSIWRGFVC